MCRRHDLIVPRSCRRYLLLMLIGLGCAVGCAVVPSYFSAAVYNWFTGYMHSFDINFI